MNYYQRHRFSYSKGGDSEVSEEIEFETDAVSLDDMVDMFERYLKATGFVFEGYHLELMEDG